VCNRNSKTLSPALKLLFGHWGLVALVASCVTRSLIAIRRKPAESVPRDSFVAVTSGDTRLHPLIITEYGMFSGKVRKSLFAGGIGGSCLWNVGERIGGKFWVVSPSDSMTGRYNSRNPDNKYPTNIIYFLDISAPLLIITSLSRSCLTAHRQKHIPLPTQKCPLK